MASGQKTERYGLNQWSGSDRPKRVDFNADNAAIDAALAAVADTVADTLDEIYDALEGVGNLDGALAAKVPLDSTGEFYRQYRVLAHMPPAQTSGAGTLKIKIPSGFGDAAIAVKLSATGWGGAAVPFFEMIIQGLPAASIGQWRETDSKAHLLAGSLVDDTVRFGVDAEGQLCILVGGSAPWYHAAVTLEQATMAIYGDTYPQREGWELSVITDTSDITFSGGTLHANTPALSIAHPAWYTLPLTGGVTAPIGGYEPQYSKVGSLVTVRGSFRFPAGAKEAVNGFTMPSGYRPGGGLMRFFLLSNANAPGDGTLTACRIRADGVAEFAVSPYSSVWQEGNSYNGYVTYVAEG